MMAGRVLNIRHGSAPGAIYIGRGSPWGNPYRIGVHGDRERVLLLYKVFVLPRLDLAPLLGHDLLCHCTPLPCHGDLIIQRLYKGL